MKKEKKSILILHISHLSIASSFISVALALLCITQYGIFSSFP